MASGQPRKRYEELDALRGLASATVVLHHLVLIFPIMYAASWALPHHRVLNAVRYSPAHVFFAGHEAVILFFVLSGFVLALPYVQGRADTYRNFLTRRVLRIYPAYLVALVAAVVARNAFDSSRGGKLSVWYHQDWAGPQTLSSIVRHVLLVPSFNDQQYDPVVWSLVHEIRISLIFPVLVAVVLRIGWRASLAGAFLLSVIGALIDHKNSTQQIGLTISYMAIFIFGILLAQHQQEIRAAYRARPQLMRRLLFVLAVTLYCYPWLAPQHSMIHKLSTNDLVTAAGACIFVVMAVSSNWFGAFLRHRINVFLGHASYSLYLIHTVILLTLLHVAYGSVPTVLIIIATPALAIPTAWLMYRYVELPFIRLGRKLTAASRPTPRSSDDAGSRSPLPSRQPQPTTAP